MKSDFKKNSVDIQTIFSTTTKKSIFPHKAPFKNLMFVWGDSVEKPKLLLLPSWSRKSETTKRLLFLFSFRWSNFYFSVTINLSTQNNVLIKQFSYVEEDSVENLSLVIHASYSCQSESGEKCCSYCFRSIIKLACLRHYKFEFLKQDLILQSNTCRGIWKWQINDCFPCIKILIDQISLKNFFSFFSMFKFNFKFHTLQEAWFLLSRSQTKLL